MNKKHLIIPALLTALLGASAASVAQDRYHGGDRDNGSYGQRDRSDDRRDNRDSYQSRDSSQSRDSYQSRDAHQSRDSYQARGGGRYGNEGYGGEHHWDGAGPSHDLYRGNRLPDRFRNHQYVVNNWREHRLRPPPRGYQWVQTGGDYVLAAVATGIIADLIVNH